MVDPKNCVGCCCCFVTVVVVVSKENTFCYQKTTFVVVGVFKLKLVFQLLHSPVIVVGGGGVGGCCIFEDRI